MKKFSCSSITKSGKNCKNYAIQGKEKEKNAQKCWVHSFSITSVDESEEREKNNNHNFWPSLYNPKKQGTDKNSARWASVLENTEEIYGILDFKIVHSKEFNQTIFLFGENHYKYDVTECEAKNDVIMYASYIRTYIKALLLAYADHCFFDIYFERYFLMKKKKLQPMPKWIDTNIPRLEELFSGCLHKIVDKKCDFSNIRVHAVDVRMISVNFSGRKYYAYFMLMRRLINDLNERINQFDEYRGEEIILDEQQKIQHLFHPIKKDKKGQYNLEKIQKLFHVDEKSNVVKELNSIDDIKFHHKTNIKTLLLNQLNEVKKKITTFYINEAEQIFNMVDNVYKQHKVELNERNLTVFAYLRDELTKLLYKMINITAEIVDLYTLGRIFHKFKYKTQEQKQNDFPTYATNIIYYAGLTHTRYTYRVLKYLGFEDVYTTQTQNATAESKACVKAPSLEKLKEKLIPWPDA